MTLRRGGPEARAIAMRLLAEGMTARAVAASLGVNEDTVHRWHKSEAGQSEFERFKAERDVSLRDTVDEARTKLKSLAIRAAQVLEEQLDSNDEEVANRAARTILDRVGVPRTERVETTPAEDLDYAKLSDDEVRTLRDLRAKAKKG